MKRVKVWETRRAMVYAIWIGVSSTPLFPMRKKRRRDLCADTVDRVFFFAVVIESSDELTAHAAGIDTVIIREVYIDVEGKTMP